MNKERLISIANKELQKCRRKLAETESKWNEYMDLKLHEAFCCDPSFEIDGFKIVVDDEKQRELFYDFCEASFELFKEDLDMNFGINFDSLAEYVGRTSKFYLGDLHNDCKDKACCALNEASETFDYYQSAVKDDLTIDEAELEAYTDEELEEELLDIIENVYVELCDTLDPIIKVYDIIHDFKEQQTEYFRDWVECYFRENVV